MQQDDTVPCYEIQPGKVYIAVLEGNEFVGIGIGTWLANRLISWDFGLRIKYRGKGSEVYGNLILDYYKNHFSDVKQMVIFPEYNKPTWGYAIKTGFKDLTRIEKAVMKDNMYYAIIMMERI